MILVTGAGGKTGKAVLKALVARGAAVRAFVRNTQHRESLAAIGVRDIAVGEMDDPRALSQAVQGTNAIYHICPNVSPHELPFAEAAGRSRHTPGVSASGLSLRAASADRGDAASLGQAAGRGDAVQLRSLTSPSCSPPPICRTALAEWDRMIARGHLSRALPDRHPAQPCRSRRCRGSRRAGADERRPFRRDLRTGRHAAAEPDRDRRDVRTGAQQDRSRRSRDHRRAGNSAPAAPAWTTISARH